jgi:hypothetical protein
MIIVQTVLVRYCCVNRWPSMGPVHAQAAQEHHVHPHRTEQVPRRRTRRNRHRHAYHVFFWGWAVTPEFIVDEQPVWHWNKASTMGGWVGLTALSVCSGLVAGITEALGENIAVLVRGRS